MGTLSPVTVGELVYFGPSDSSLLATIGVITGVVVASILMVVTAFVVAALLFRLKLKKFQKSKKTM